MGPHDFTPEDVFETGNPFADPREPNDPFASAFFVEGSAQSSDGNIGGKKDRRVSDLERRLAEAEETNKTLQGQLAASRQPRRNNWPPFFPVIYHSISNEIPKESQPIVRNLYILWLVLIGTLLVNVVGCIFILAAGARDGGRDLGSSIGYIFVIGPLSFLLWYRPVYNAYMKEQSLYYYFYFFFCGWHLVFSAYMIIGLPGTGSAGLIQSIQMIQQHHFAAFAIGIIATVGWSILCFGNAYYYFQVWKHKTAQGHTVSAARADLQTMGVKGIFFR